MDDTLSPESLQHIRQVVELAVELDLAELTVRETDGFTVSVKTYEEVVAAPVPIAPPLSRISHPPSGQVSSRPSPAKVGLPLLSPMTGIFYRSISPGEPFLVNDGDAVLEGQTIGLIEAMKVFSEIPSESSGTVIRFAAEDGKLLQQGHPILFLDPS